MGRVHKLLLWFNPVARRNQQEKENVLKYGMILFGLNAAVLGAFVLSAVVLFYSVSLLQLQGFSGVLLPLMLIFVFAGCSSVMWYRFGQIIGNVFKRRAIANASLVVMVAVVPLLALTLVAVTLQQIGILQLAYPFLALLLGMIFFIVLSVAFALVVINLGVLTRR